MGSASHLCVLYLPSCLLGRIRLKLGTHSHMQLCPDLGPVCPKQIYVSWKCIEKFHSKLLCSTIICACSSCTEKPQVLFLHGRRQLVTAMSVPLHDAA